MSDPNYSRVGNGLLGAGVVGSTRPAPRPVQTVPAPAGAREVKPPISLDTPSDPIQIGDKVYQLTPLGEGLVIGTFFALAAAPISTGLFLLRAGQLIFGASAAEVIEFEVAKELGQEITGGNFRTFVQWALKPVLITGPAPGLSLVALAGLDVQPVIHSSGGADP